MAQSPSSNFSFTGLLKSSHALLGVLAIVLCTILGISIAAGFMFGAYCAIILFSVLVFAVLCRYCLNGPETDRIQPTVSVTHHDNRIQTTHITNVEATEEIISIIRAVQNRRPLPAPDGIIEGLASDESSIRPISPELAQTLSEQDSQLMSSAVKYNSLPENN